LFHQGHILADISKNRFDALRAETSFYLPNRIRAGAPESGIMSNAWKTTIVRVKRPPDVSPVDFLASLRSWLSHHCIVLANFDSVVRADIEDIFVAEFDSPRDACQFARRFVIPPILSRPQPLVSIVAMRTALRSWARRPPMPVRRPVAA
jgi:hypothetical protein